MVYWFHVCVCTSLHPVCSNMTIDSSWLSCMKSDAPDALDASAGGGHWAHWHRLHERRPSRGCQVALQDLWPSFLSAYDVKTELFETSKYLNGVIARVYYEKFKKHCHWGNLRAVLSALHDSKLLEQTKGMLPGVMTMECTAKNVNWLLQYWLSACDDVTQQYPDQVQECYWFKCRGRWGFVA